MSAHNESMRAAREALDVSLPSFYFMHFYYGYKGGLTEQERNTFIISIQVDEAENATPTLFGVTV